MRPKDMPSSALRPPPSHPILKKPSGPQSTGPRPTARFVSPHVSEGETENQDDIPSSGSTVTPGLEMRLVTVKSPPKKKPSGAGRKFVASAGKRRPMIARKTSSHSAVGSADSGSTREEPTSSTTKNSRVLSQVASPVTEPFPTLNNNLLSAPVETPPKPSAKALGKRPVVPYTLPINSKPESSQQPSQKALCSSENKTALIMNPKLALTEEVPERLPSKEIKPILPTRPRPSPIQQPSQILSSSYESRSSAISLDKTPRSQRKQLDPSMTQQSVVRLPSHPQLAIENQKQRSDASDLSDSSTVVGSVRSPLCRTFSGLIRRESGFSQGLFTSATACTTNIEAHGAIIDQSGNTSPLPIAGQGAVRRFDGDMPMSPSSILDSHLTPTPPSNAPPVPLGRTRSQLNILLDRENERNARKSWARG